MRSVICINAACRRAVEFPDTAPAGMVYACPTCKQDLPPVPESAKTPPPDGFSASSAVCALGAGLTVLLPFIWPASIPIAAAGVLLGIFGLWTSRHQGAPAGCAISSLVACLIVLTASLVYLILQWENLTRLFRGY